MRRTQRGAVLPSPRQQVPHHEFTPPVNATLTTAVGSSRVKKPPLYHYLRDPVVDVPADVVDVLQRWNPGRTWLVRVSWRQEDTGTDGLAADPIRCGGVRSPSYARSQSMSVLHDS